MGIKLCNKLSNEIKNIRMEKMFKRKLKEMLLEVEPYSVTDFLQS